MLGNFLLSVIISNMKPSRWSWGVFDQVVGLDPESLYPFIYENDDEAFEIWNKEIGIAPERIFRFGKRRQLLGAWRRSLRSVF